MHQENILLALIPSFLKYSILSIISLKVPRKSLTCISYIINSLSLGNSV